MINWHRAGKPDFSKVAQWFSRFAPDFRNSFNRSEEKTLLFLIFYTWNNAFHSGRGSQYCSFSQEEVGKRFGRSRWTVARALERFARRDWIRVIHRRPRPGGKWQTNVYILSGKVLAALRAVIHPNRTTSSPCSKTAPQESIQNSIKKGPDPSLEGPGPSLQKNISADENERREVYSDEMRAKLATLFPRIFGPKPV